MRILVLIYEYPPVGGGGGRVAQDICRAMAKRGHSVCVLTAHCTGLAEEEDDQGVRVIRLKTGRSELFRASFRVMLRYILAAIWHGTALVRRWKPDLMHVHFAVPTGAAARMIRALTGVPYVLTAHLGDVPGGVPEKTGKWFRWVKPFTPPIWSGAARVAAVSQFTRELARQHYRVPIDVIPNGVDREALDPGEIRLNRPAQLVFAGRFMQQKNPVALVRVLAGLRDLDWQCTMLGDGPLRPTVEQEIAACGLQERFSLPGWVDPEQVIAAFRRSDILFMPSLSEGLPVVGVQAMAMGLAIVAGKVGGFIELVEQGGNGTLHAPDDEEGFRASLRALIEDPAHLLAARKASRELSARYDLNKVADAYERIFHQSVKSS